MGLNSSSDWLSPRHVEFSCPLIGRVLSSQLYDCFFLAAYLAAFLDMSENNPGSYTSFSTACALRCYLVFCYVIYSSVTFNKSYHVIGDVIPPHHAQIRLVHLQNGSEAESEEYWYKSCQVSAVYQLYDSWQSCYGFQQNETESEFYLS